MISSNNIVHRFLFAWLFIVVFAANGGRGASPAPVVGPANELTLREYLDRVLAENDRMQISLLETEIARKKVQAEQGVFEPDLVGTFNWRINPPIT